MKKNRKIILFFMVLFSLNSYTQIIYYTPLSNIFSADERKGIVNIGVGFEFTNVQTQIVYNLNRKFILFGTYNFDKFKVTNTPLFFGSTTVTKKNNSGYSIGSGMQFKLANANLELLAGFEKQYIDNHEKFANSKLDLNSWQLSEEYSNPFIQANIILVKNRLNYAFLFKLSYLHLLKFQSSNNPSYIMKTSVFEGKSSFVTSLSFGLDYKLFSKRNLIVNTQIGLSNFLQPMKHVEKTEVVSSETTQTVANFIIKLGLQYKFKTL